MGDQTVGTGCAKAAVQGAWTSVQPLPEVRTDILDCNCSCIAYGWSKLDPDCWGCLKNRHWLSPFQRRRSSDSPHSLPLLPVCDFKIYRFANNVWMKKSLPVRPLFVSWECILLRDILVTVHQRWSVVPHGSGGCVV